MNNFLEFVKRPLFIIILMLFLVLIYVLFVCRLNKVVKNFLCHPQITSTDLVLNEPVDTVRDSLSISIDQHTEPQLVYDTEPQLTEQPDTTYYSVSSDNTTTSSLNIQVQHTAHDHDVNTVSRQKQLYIQENRQKVFLQIFNVFIFYCVKLYYIVLYTKLGLTSTLQSENNHHYSNIFKKVCNKKKVFVKHKANLQF
jgi:hypothetical protein